MENLLETYKLNEIIFLTPPRSKFIDFYNENSKYKISEYNFEFLKQKDTGPFHTTIKKFKGHSPEFKLLEISPVFDFITV